MYVDYADKKLHIHRNGEKHGYTPLIIWTEEFAAVFELELIKINELLMKYQSLIINIKRSKETYCISGK